MRESEEAARLDIANDSLKHFIYRRGEPVTRNEFFVTTSPPGSALHDKALRSRGWQKAFIQHLTDYSFLRQVKHGDTIKYEIFSDAANTFLLLCTVDRDYYHGVLVSRLVFGGLQQEGFLKLCVKRFSEMKAEGFESIDNEKHKQTMLHGFPDLTQLVSDEPENPQILLKMIEEEVREEDEDEGEGDGEAIVASAPQPTQLDEEVTVHPLDDEEAAARPTGTPLWSKGLASTVMAQARALLSVEALLRELVEQEIPAIAENIQTTRTDLRDNKKASDELVKSLQGLLKQHAGLSQIDIPAKLAELEAYAKTSTKALDELSENVKVIARAVSSLTDRQEKMFEQMTAARDDKLGQAARDLEAVHALITEALAQRRP